MQSPVIRRLCFLLLGLLAGHARADVIPGTGVLEGAVTADAPFKAAKVIARNADRRMTYLVYTAGGRYRAINVLPGSYELTVEKQGFAVDARRVEVKVGESVSTDFKLRPDTLAEQVQGGRVTAGYDEIYPPGAGRVVLEATCMRCHGKSFIAQRAGLEAAGWNALIDVMMSMKVGGTDRSVLPPGTLTPERRAVLVEYLGRHLGPGTPARSLRVDESVELDERALSSAMWIQYAVAQPRTPAGDPRKFQETYFDLKGNVWITETTKGSPAINRLDPRTQTWSWFPVTNVEWYPHGLAVDPVDGSVWWAGRGVDVVRLDPSTGKFTPYGDLSSTQRWGGHTPAFDSKGDLWYTLIFDNQVGKWDRKTKTVTHWDIPNKGGQPYGMLIDQQDRIWFAELLGCRVTQFDPSTERFTEYVSPSSPCRVRRPGLDSKGRIWFGVYDSGKLDMVDPRTGRITEYDIDRFAEPYEAWADPDDKIWMSDGGRGGVLIRFDPETKTFTNYPGIELTDMPKIAITREGAVWYNNRGAAARGRAPAAVGVLYPDVNKMTSFEPYYAIKDGRAVGSGSPRPAPATPVRTTQVGAGH